MIEFNHSAASVVSEGRRVPYLPYCAEKLIFHTSNVSGSLFILCMPNCLSTVISLFNAITTFHHNNALATEYMLLRLTTI
jgi:hypothetical protein